MPTGKDILERVNKLLTDEDFDRWEITELVDWIHEGALAIVIAKPNAFSSTRPFKLTNGTRQSIGAATGAQPLKLLDIVRNLSDDTAEARAGRVVSIVSRSQLDAVDPNWHDPRYVKFRKEVRHYTFDEQNPLEFYVWPGNDGNGVVEALFSFSPKKLEPTGPKDALSSYNVELGIQEPYAVPLVDYVCYRALSKDDLQGAPAKAMAYYQAFATALGIKIQSASGANPNARRAGT